MNTNEHARPGWGSEPWAECCCFGSKEWPDAMARCFSFCRYFLLFPVLLGILFLTLGYILGPEVIRPIWMVGAGILAGIGLLAFLAMSRFAAGSNFFGCCGGWSEQKNTERGDATDATPAK